jgi:hypothetical protein
MQKIVEKFITHAISGEDILNICNGEANLMTNTEIKSAGSIDEVLGKYGACIILYDKGQKPGHWSCIIKQANNMLEFFCPYGLSIDEAIEFTGGAPNLSNLIRQSNYRLYFNDYPLQKYKNDINVCGRYTGMRILLRNTPLRNFINLFTKNKHYSSDFWITVLTLFCEN